MSAAGRLAGLGICLCVLAGAFAVSALYVPGVALIALVCASEASVRLAARGARVQLDLTSTSVQEGGAAQLTLRWRSWPLALSRGEMQTLPDSPWVPIPRGGEPGVYELRPSRRGELIVGPAAVRFRDPFGICARTRASSTRRLLVLPAVSRVPRGELERILALAPAPVSVPGGAGADGLAPYRQGAPASRIHWLTVARTGALMERRAEGDPEVLPAMVALDASAPFSEEALDRAVRAAASLCLGFAALGGCSVLLPGASTAQPLRPDLAAWPRLHAKLALVRAGESLDRRAAERAPLLIWVTGGRTQAPARAALAATVSPLPREGQLMFTVAGCTVQAARGPRARAA